MNYKYLVAVMLLMVVACRNQGADAYFENCKYGKPEAIFDAGHPDIVEHRFMLKREEGVEEIVFKSDKELTIRQMGCDVIRQEFTFVLPGRRERNPSDQWVNQTVREFQYLAGLDTRYLMFSSWAQAIAEQREEISLAESVEIQPGFYVKIDRVVGAENATLIVTLSETP